MLVSSVPPHTQFSKLRVPSDRLARRRSRIYATPPNLEHIATERMRRASLNCTLVCIFVEAPGIAGVVDGASKGESAEIGMARFRGTLGPTDA